MPGAVSRWNAKKDLSWVPLRPELVVEIKYDQLEGRRLRHTGQFLRWRPDRDPLSCTYDQLDVPVHLHTHETAQEIADSIRDHGQRPLARLDRLGLVNDRLIAVHMTQLTEAEMHLCAERGVAVVHCPESNLKLASGFCPACALQRAGVNLAIGTDSCASNNDLDMFGEMRTAALLGHAAMAQWVLFRLDGGIDHILVDEAQDTSPRQWQVIEGLTAEFPASDAAAAGRRPRTLFEKIVARQPFPGPGLGIRIIGEVTGDRLEIHPDSAGSLDDVLEQFRKALDGVPHGIVHVTP